EHGVDLRRLDVARGDEAVAARLRFDGKEAALGSIDLSSRSVSIATILAKAGIEAPVDGTLDLTLRGDRDESGLAAAGHATARGVRVGREIFDTVDADLVIEGDLVVLRNVQVRGSGIDARGTVTYHIASKQAEIDVDRAVMDVAQDRTLAEAGLGGQGTV